MILDLNDTQDDFVTLSGAVVVPPLTAEQRRDRPSGVLDADGNFVQNSINWTNSTQPVNGAPEIPAGAELSTLPGHHIYGGVFYGHFGHFIVESMSRVWALDALRGQLDGIVFTPKVDRVDDRVVAHFKELLAAFGVDLPITLIREPTRIETLSVPRQGFGMYDLIGGSAAFRDYINTHFGKNVPAAGPQKLYISRSRLGPGRGSILGEYKIEQYLQAEGYEIFHPQFATQNEQIAHYKAARMIVSTDCSPIHLLGYAGDAGQKAAILTRRSMEIGAYLAEQLRIFKGMQAIEINALTNDWMPQPGRRPSRSSWGEIDFPKMHAQLLAAGLIGNPEPWSNLSPEEHAAELERLSAQHKTSFTAFRETA